MGGKVGRTLGKAARVKAGIATFGGSELLGLGRGVEGMFSGKGLFGESPQAPGMTPEEREMQKLAVGQAREAGRIRTAGLERLQKEAKEDPRGIARAQVEREIAGERASTEDARRRLQQLVAQRGLQRSAVGLGAEAKLTRDLASRQARLRASIPERERTFRQAQTSRLLAAAGGRTPFQSIQVEAQPGRPGLFPALTGIGGGIAGGIFGGPVGAIGGYQAGTGLGQLISANRRGG